MRLQKKHLVAFICLLSIACKKESNSSTGGTINKLTTILKVDGGAMNVFSDTLAATHDTITAINAVGQWLLDQPDVKDAYYWSSTLIEIHFINGMRSSVNFIWEDANGQHLTRGGGGGSSLKQFSPNGTNAKKNIKNDKVLVLNPFDVQFFEGHYNKRGLYNGGPHVLDVTILNGDSVNYDILSSFGEFGFINLNTHGVPWGFIMEQESFASNSVSIKDWTKDDVLPVLNGWFGPHIPLEKFENGELELNGLGVYKDFIHNHSIVSYVVTDKFIRNASFDLEGTVVFNNSCYSGYTFAGPNIDNQPEAFRSKGVSCYYGYAFENNNSGSAPNPFALRMEDSLLANLVRRGDTTAVAHLIDDVTKQYTTSSDTRRLEDVPVHITRGTVFRPATPAPPGYDKLYFKQFFDLNYCYSKCGDTITDTRDGQKYATVCIGNQIWMKKNLNYAGAGKCYNNSSLNCDTYGRLYKWQEATNNTSSATNPSNVRGVCPEGWHMPSDLEWTQLTDYLGGKLNAGGPMKSTTGWTLPNVGATNSSDFSALPGGYMDVNPVTGNLVYQGINSSATFWSSTLTTGNTEANWRHLSSDWNEVAVGSFFITRYCSVRCVKD